jgi:hypothetical protein
MSDSDSGGSSSTRLSVFKGGVNGSYPHYRIKLISLLNGIDCIFLLRGTRKQTPHCLWEENMKGRLSPHRPL